MIEYDLAKLARAKRPRTGQVILNPIQQSLQVERSYLAALRRMQKGIVAAFRSSVLPAYRVDRLTKDVDTNTFGGMRGVAAALLGVTDQTIQRILGLEAIRHSENFMIEARKALGVDLTGVVQQEDLNDYLRVAVSRNTSLIKSQSDDIVKRIEQAVLNNETLGRSVATLKKKLVDEMGIADRRSQLIARDQTAKLNSDMNKIRQQQAGIDDYQWSTAHDERVRSLHRSLEGKQYGWNEPTGAEDGLPPGQPIQCRCVARAVVDFGDDPKARKPGPGPALPAVETVPERTARLDQEARNYVLNLGRADGAEHLSAFDVDFGLPVEKHTDGKKGAVSFSPALIQIISNPRSNIHLHHNHPGSTSFSAQDLDVLERFRGMKAMFAHGHNGSLYRAERGTVQYAQWAYRSINDAVKAQLQAMVTARTLAVEDANILHAHIVSLIVSKKGMAKYTFDLKGPTLDAVTRNQATIDAIVKGAK